MSKYINYAGENAYYYCNGCGVELVGEEVGEVGASNSLGSSDYGYCPICGKDNVVNWDKEE